MLHLRKPRIVFAAFVLVLSSAFLSFLALAATARKDNSIPTELPGHSALMMGTKAELPRYGVAILLDQSKP